jgi:hypothetical protein
MSLDGLGCPVLATELVPVTSRHTRKREIGAPEPASEVVKPVIQVRKSR